MRRRPFAPSFRRASWPVLAAALALFPFPAPAALAQPAAASPAAPVAAQAEMARIPAVARVIEAGSTRAVVQGPGVADLVPRMPVWILEFMPGNRPGLLLAEGVVVSIFADRAVVEVAEKDVQALRPGALVEPRWQAEARLYRGAVQAMPGRDGAPGVKADAHAMRGRHRSPPTVSWGSPLWIEVALEGPADKAFALWRMGAVGPFTEIELQPKGDGLFGGWLPLSPREAAAGEPQPAGTMPEVDSQPGPRERFVQYYVVASGPAGRVPVAGHPAEPLNVAIAGMPEREHETRVSHGPVDRATHKKPLVLTAEVNMRFTRPTLFYRARGSGSFQALPMTLVQPELYRAEIPARSVVTPGLAYYIAVTDEKGIVRDGFGSNRSPHNVEVLQPQILSNEENRNELSLVYAFAQFGRDNDVYHDVGLGLERLFFGFLVARLAGGAMIGLTERDVAAVTKPGQKPTDPLEITTPAHVAPANLRLYRGHAGLDVHLGDYFALSGDLAMALFGAGGGFGFRAGVRIGDEQIAAVSLQLEQIWNTKTEEKVIDQWRATLATPVGDSVRLFGSAIQEKILQRASVDPALRLVVGVEWDATDQVQIEASGGMAGRSATPSGDAAKGESEANIGASAGAAFRVRF